MNVINARFASPIYRRVEPEAGRFNADLEHLILARENDQYRLADTPQPLHPGVFESRFDFLDWPVAPVTDFRQLMIQRLGYFLSQVTELPQADIARLQVRHESWFHVTRTGGYVRMHTHPNASWSFIYCVNPGSPDNPSDAGHLLISDPRVNANMYLDPANASLKSAFTHSGWRFVLQAGELLFFPSFLPHSVEPYHGKSPRITVAGNLRFNHGR